MDVIDIKRRCVSLEQFYTKNQSKKTKKKANYNIVTQKENMNNNLLINDTNNMLPIHLMTV